MSTLLVKALKNKFEMTNKDAAALASTVKEIFNGRKEIEDMTVDKHVRSLFYELHREKLLRLRREEYKEQGKYIRKYYWSFDERTIKEEAQKKTILEESPYVIYQKIPRSAWLSHTYNT